MSPGLTPRVSDAAELKMVFQEVTKGHEVARVALTPVTSGQ